MSGGHYGQVLFGGFPGLMGADRTVFGNYGFLRGHFRFFFTEKEVSVPSWPAGLLYFPARIFPRECGAPQGGYFFGCSMSANNQSGRI